MAQNGYLAARIYTSGETLPVEGAVITVISNEGGIRNIAGKRVTDRNGQIVPVTLSAPDEELSLSPGNGEVFSLFDVRIDKPEYYSVLIKNVQIFAGQTTLVDTQLIPLIENAPPDDRAEQFIETPQNL